MEEVHKLRLQKMHLKLIQDVDSVEVVPYLIQEGILSDFDVDEIRSQCTRRAKMTTLLRILPRKGPNAFQAFCSALSISYEWLTKEMTSLDVNDNNICKDLEIQRSQELTSEMVDYLRHNASLQRRWHTLAHALRLTQNGINIQVQANIFLWGPDVCVLHVLEKWQEENGKAATVGALLDALRMEKFNSVADELESRFLLT